ncbi:hypothetical protein GCM10011505_00690 [Tistrella bauzanensis]|uniref:Cupin type-2 domain-containing protein n=1 Tax=Tistrella bauzanensis TaxID=657419 RepID=A0ABQ1I882_9PROT|nr:cupin domain-containing protein [Tistrella bauzanensis]GGB23339.1 hypothetical protein GCM10011505_00690 [Tistrella bauzanensis]
MDVHSIDEIAGGLPLLTVGPGTTQADFMTAMRPLGVANGCVASLLRYTGQVPWERHPQDEQVFVLKGAIHLTLLHDAGPEQILIEAGNFVVIPAGVWHHPMPAPEATSFAVTSMVGTEHSVAQDPRAA